MEKEFLTQIDCFKHDSGDCLEWVKKMIENFKKYGIDMSTKTLIVDSPIEETELYKMVVVNWNKVESILEMTKNENLKVEFV